VREEDAGVPAPDPKEQEYFRAIEERFCALRGASMLLSPRDWGLIAGWWERQIPLFLVLETLEDLFAGRRRRGDDPNEVNSLAYARAEILRRWKLRLAMSSPRREEPEESERLREHLRRHLARVVRSLKEAASRARGAGLEPLARTILEVAAELQRLRKEAGAKAWDPLLAEGALEKLDAEILQAASAALEGPRRAALELEATEILAPGRAGMRPEAFRQSLQAVHMRLLRREFGLPHLSLLGET
jgi:hypothetical protein